VALGFGGLLGLYGALLQTLNHAIAKAVLFLTSGDVSLRYHTREAAGVRGLLAAAPVTGGALLLGSFAVLGSPPFGVFLSELTIVRAGFAGSSPVFPLLLLALLAVAFVAFARTITAMVTGRPSMPTPSGRPDESEFGAHLTAPDPLSSPEAPRWIPGTPRGMPTGVSAEAGGVAVVLEAAPGEARGETPGDVPGEPGPGPYRGRTAGLAAIIPLGVGLVALLVLGLWIPAGLDTLIRHCVAVMS
jgi:NADH:ubiquinone oxidoreductase subunit 5 (subunit L)/multisubunit Na+/H+ antiporter MnhA subunit